jgi:hypothetical protein
LDHAKMKEPDDPARRPNRDFLAERFEQFNAAA